MKSNRQCSALPSDGILRVWNVTGSKHSASHLFSLPDGYFPSFSFWISLILFFFWSHVKLPQVLPSEFFWFVSFCFVLLYMEYVRMDAKFYQDRKKAYLHWRLYCKVWGHWRVFVFKQVILYWNRSWRYPAAWACSPHCLVSCPVSFWLL